MADWMKVTRLFRLARLSVSPFPACQLQHAREAATSLKIGRRRYSAAEAGTLLHGVASSHPMCFDVLKISPDKACDVFIASTLHAANGRET